MSTSPSLDDDATPLSIEPVLGWRVWRLLLTPDGPRLGSTFRPDVWPPGEVMSARCDRHPADEVPDIRCACGLYATSSPEALAAAGVFNAGIGVIGAVAMWGRVVEHDRGARSRVAYPARIRLACGPCLAEGWGAVEPSRVIGSSRAAQVLCAQHVRSPGSGRDAADVEAELLSAYAVDLLPIEMVASESPHTLARRGAAGVVTRAASRPRSAVGGFVRLIVFLVKLLVGIWLASLGLALALWILGGILHTVGIGVHAPATAVPTPVTRVLRKTPTEDDEALRGIDQEPKPRIVPFAGVCGSGHWDHIRIVRCMLPSAHLLGFASLETPNGPDHDCIGPWIAYTRGHHYWICWDVPFGGAKLTPWARAPNPWSIPFAKGGAAR